MSIILRGAAAALMVAAVLPTPVSAQAKEKCYGVALAGRNDGIASPSAGGTKPSTVDYQGNAWILVDSGSCETIAVPGNRQGSRQPLKRDLPS